MLIKLNRFTNKKLFLLFLVKQIFSKIQRFHFIVLIFSSRFDYETIKTPRASGSLGNPRTHDVKGRELR